MDYITCTVTVDNKQVLLQLWDTAGQERFGPITAVYCRRADAFILVYDITNRDSFVGIRGWVDFIKVSLIWLPLLLHGNNYYTQLLEMI